MDTHTFKPMRPYSILLALNLAQTFSRVWNRRVRSRQDTARNMITSSRSSQKLYSSGGARR